VETQGMVLAGIIEKTYQWADEGITALVGSQSSIYESDETANAIWSSFYELMLSWALGLDQYRLSKDSKALENRNSTFEDGMKALTKKCNTAGYRFEYDWSFN